MDTPVGKGGVRDQVEWWFGDDNAARDSFLRSRISEDPEGYVSLDVVAGFKRLKEVNVSAADIATAFNSVPSPVVEISPDGKRIRRRSPLPQYISKKECTVVAGMSRGMTAASLRAAMEACGKVFTVTVIPSTNAKKGGYGIVQYISPDSVPTAIRDLPGRNGVRTVVTLEQWNANRDELKKRRRDEPDGDEEDAVEECVGELSGKGVVCLMGPVRQDITSSAIKGCLQPIAKVAAVDTRMLKLSRFTDEDPTLCRKPPVDVHVRFGTEDEANAAIAAASDGRVTVDGKAVRIIALEGDEADRYDKFSESCREKGAARQWKRNTQRIRRAEARSVAKQTKHRAEAAAKPRANDDKEMSTPVDATKATTATNVEMETDDRSEEKAVGGAIPAPAPAVVVGDGEDLGTVATPEPEHEPQRKKKKETPKAAKKTTAVKEKKQRKGQAMKP